MSVDNTNTSENGGYAKMKPKYAGYEAKKSGGYIQLPPEGSYIGQIQAVRVEKTYDKTHDQLVLLLDITEGEYANRYTEQYNDAKERYPDTKNQGVFRIAIPEENDPAELAWMKSKFEGSLWAVEQSNPGYAWDWDEKKLAGKKVGFSVRKSFYTGKDKDGNPVDRETTEIGRLESIDEVKAGKVKPMQPRDSRTNKTDDNGTDSYADVTGSVEVPF